MSAVGSLYDALDDPSHINGFLESAIQEFRASNAGLGFVDVGTGDHSYVSTHIPEEHQKLYLSAMEEDPWMAATLERPRVPHVVRCSDLVLQKEYRNSLFYQDLMRPVDVEYALASGWLGPRYSIFLQINRSKRGGDFGGRELSQLEPVTPHIIRFANLLYEGRALAGERRDFDVPCFHTDSLSIRWMNDEARRLLEIHPCLSIKGGRVVLCDGKSNARFQELVADVCRRRWDRLPVRQLATVKVDRRDRLLIVPRSRIAPNFNRSYYAAVVIVCRSQTRTFSAVAAESYGLSPSERRVAEAIVRGKTLAEQAEETDRSIHTLRTHLKRVLQKTGASSQIALIHKLTSE